MVWQLRLTFGWRHVLPCVSRLISTWKLSAAGLLTPGSRIWKTDCGWLGGAQFKRILRSNDCLLMAHHQDDQAETVLLRLLRGAGPTGLGAIPHRRRLGEGTLFRPLLDVPRSLLTEWATARDLQWFDDPANKDSRFDRNFLRQDVLPLLAKRWPGYRGTLARVARHQSNLARDLSANIADDLSPLGEPVWEIDPGVVDDDIVRALHCWLIQQPVNAPDLVRLEEFARQILTSRFDRIPELAWGEMCLRKWRSHVYLGPRRISLFQDRLRLAVGQSVEGDWGRLDWQSSERGLSEGHIVECRRRLPGERLALWVGPCVH